jgi:5-methylcytosine-specific restriction protein A
LTKSRNQTDNRKLRQKAYNNTKWKKLRDVYLREHAVCTECLSKGKVTPATSVHHIKTPFINGEINYHLLLDYTNLMSLCNECHGNIHAKEQGHKSPERIIEELEALFENADRDVD